MHIFCALRSKCLTKTYNQASTKITINYLTQGQEQSRQHEYYSKMKTGPRKNGDMYMKKVNTKRLTLRYVPTRKCATYFDETGS